MTMSNDNDLIALLRDCSSDEAMWSRQAADRIEALVGEVKRLTGERDRFEAALGRACLVGGTTYLIDRAEAAEAKVAKLVEALRKIADGFGCECGEEARAALAEIEGLQ